MHAGKDAHWHVPRIVADEHLVDFQNRSEFLVERLSRNMRQIEIDLIFAVDPKTLETHLEDFARGDVAGHQIAVSRILLFQKIKTLFFRYRRRRSFVAFCPRHPYASTFTVRRFAHQTQFIFAGYRSWLHLNELTIS